MRAFPSNRLALGQGAIGVLSTVATVLVVVDQDVASGLSGHPELRLVIEVSGLFLALSAAVVLGLATREDLGAPRDAFIAAMLVLAITNAVFSVGPVVVGVRPVVDRGLAFYPWIVSRFVGGSLLLAAGFHRPRLGPWRTILVAFGALAALDLAVVAAGDRLPVPVALSPATHGVEVVSWSILTPLMLIPAVLFAVGSAAAARLHRRGDGPPLLAWLSAAMLMQAMAQVHGLLSPAFLGPVVTTMDLFRTGSWLLLAGGAVAQLRHLYRSRSHTAARQAEDLRDQAVLLARQQRLVEREADFRAIVAHELATPIAAIQTFAHVLGSSAAADAQRRAALADLRAETAQLARLVDRVEELRDLEVAELTCALRPVAIRPLLEEAHAFVRGLPGHHPVRLDCDDARVQADPVRLGQLLRNVLSNAVRYGGNGVPIEILGRDEDGGGYTIEVLDDGPGIPIHEREHVLKAHARGSNADAAAGRGLGLHVARHLAQGHGSDLELASGPSGRGTIVRLHLTAAT